MKIEELHKILYDILCEIGLSKGACTIYARRRNNVRSGST